MLYLFYMFWNLLVVGSDIIIKYDSFFIVMAIIYYLDVLIRWDWPV